MAASAYEDLDEELEQYLAEAPLTYEAEGYEGARAPNTRMNGVQSDPFAIMEQQSALREMLGIAESGGVTDQDRERIAQRRALERMSSRGSEQAYGQDLRERGMASGTNDAMMAQSQAQGAATAGASANREMQAMAQRRALDAYSQAGTMGAGLREQSYGENARRAEAADRISRANADSITDARKFGATHRNAASRSNAYAPDRLYGMGSKVATGRGRELDRTIDAERDARNADRDEMRGYYEAAGGALGTIATGGNPAGTAIGQGAVKAGWDDEEDE